MLSNLMFAAQSLVGHDFNFLLLTVALENFSGGIGSAAFVAYISGLCSLSFTGTQYALFSSLAAIGRTVLHRLADFWRRQWAGRYYVVDAWRCRGSSC